jgi:hypothetical protein
MRTGVSKSIVLAVVLGTFLMLPGPAGAEEEWSQWEMQHAVAQVQDWLVIKVPGRERCYMKQSYPGPHRMELTMDSDRIPRIWGPFHLQPDDVVLRYSLDEGEQHTLHRRGVTNTISLPESIVPDLMSGLRLQVQVEEGGQESGSETIAEQTFSLRGFTAACELLESEQCR